MGGKLSISSIVLSFLPDEGRKNYSHLSFDDHAVRDKCDSVSAMCKHRVYLHKPIWYALSHVMYV